MAGKQKVPPTDSRFRTPLNVVIEKIGATRALVHGDLSKESLKELLVSSLSLVSGLNPAQQRALQEMGGLTNEQQRDLQHIAGITTVEQELLRQEKELGKGTADKIGKTVANALATEGREELGKESEQKEPKGKDEGKGKTEKDKSVKDQTQEDKLQKGRGKKPSDEKHGRQKGKEDELRKKGGKKRGRGVRRLEHIEDYGEFDWGDYGEEEESEEEMIAEEVKEEKSLSSCLTSDTEGMRMSYDGKWLRKYFMQPLIFGLRDIVSKKPYDPVGYLAFWLLEYRNSQEKARWRKDMDDELLALRNAIPQMVVEPEGEKSSRGEGEESGGCTDLNFQNYGKENMEA